MSLLSMFTASLAAPKKAEEPVAAVAAAAAAAAPLSQIEDDYVKLQEEYLKQLTIVAEAAASDKRVKVGRTKKGGGAGGGSYNKEEKKIFRDNATKRDAALERINGIKRGPTPAAKLTFSALRGLVGTQDAAPHTASWARRTPRRTARPCRVGARPAPRTRT